MSIGYLLELKNVTMYLILLSIDFDLQSKRGNAIDIFDPISPGIIQYGDFQCFQSALSKQLPKRLQEPSLKHIWPSMHDPRLFPSPWDPITLQVGLHWPSEWHKNVSSHVPLLLPFPESPLKVQPKTVLDLSVFLNIAPNEFFNSKFTNLAEQMWF